MIGVGRAVAWLDDVASEVGRIASSVGSATEESRKVFGGESFWEKATSFGSGGGKGFRFPSEAEATKMINRLEERKESIQRRRTRIQDAYGALTQFAPDHASVSYINTAQDSLRKLEELNDSALKYVTNYISKIEKVKKDKQGSDADAGAAFGGTETRA